MPINIYDASPEYEAIYSLCYEKQIESLKQTPDAVPGIATAAVNCVYNLAKISPLLTKKDINKMNPEKTITESLLKMCVTGPYFVAKHDPNFTTAQYLLKTYHCIYNAGLELEKLMQRIALNPSTEPEIELQNTMKEACKDAPTMQFCNHFANVEDWGL